jgi:two-component system response regulator WspF
MLIGIVNDLELACASIRKALAASPKHHVAWEARNGEEAVALCARETPDVVLMDLFMPVMDGVEATRRIMTTSPCTVLVVTADVAAHAARVFEAMGAGAIDAVNTPADTRNSGAPLIEKLDQIQSILRDEPPVRKRGDLIAIGASAGGPAALAQLLGALPSGFPAAVAVIQHVDVSFAAGLVSWLGQQCPLPVRLMAGGEVLKAGTVGVAGGPGHLVLRPEGLVAYTMEPESFYTPSVDVFFDSARQHWRGAITGVLLTGMGRDGAAGLKRLREARHHTIAQSREGCAVYGMPRAAAQIDAAVQILPLNDIAPALIRQCGRGRTQPGPNP